MTVVDTPDDTVPPPSTGSRERDTLSVLYTDKQSATSKIHFRDSEKYCDGEPMCKPVLETEFSSSRQHRVRCGPTGQSTPTKCRGVSVLVTDPVRSDWTFREDLRRTDTHWFQERTVLSPRFPRVMGDGGRRMYGSVVTTLRPIPNLRPPSTGIRFFVKF